MNKIAFRSFTSVLVILIIIFPIVTISSCTFIPDRNPIYLDQPPFEDFEDYVLGYAGDTFRGEQWDRNYSVEANRMTVVWTNKELVAVAQLNFYDNRNFSTNFEEYYSNEHIENILFGQYQNLRRKSSCRDNDNGIYLTEYAGELNGVPFTIRFWTINSSQTYFIDFSLIFPNYYSTQLNKVSSQLFPALSRCQGETAVNFKNNLR